MALKKPNMRNARLMRSIGHTGADQSGSNELVQRILYVR